VSVTSRVRHELLALSTATDERVRHRRKVRVRRAFARPGLPSSGSQELDEASGGRRQWNVARDHQRDRPEHTPAGHVEDREPADVQLELERESTDGRDADAVLDCQLDRLPRRELERPHGMQPELPARRFDGRPRGRALFARDPGQAAEVTPAEPATRERGGPDQHQLVVEKRLGLELCGNVQPADDSELDLVRTDELKRFPGRCQAEVQLDVRRTLVKAGKEIGNQVRARNAGRGESESSALRVGARAHGPFRVREQRLCTQDVVGEHVAGRRQPDSLAIANEQLRSQLRLERSDVLRDRRLTDVQRLGSPREGSGPDNGSERANPGLKIHELRL
jgi:hypothetical protein